MLSAIFDFSFSQFITAKLIRVLYGLLMAIAAILSLVIGIGIMNEVGGFMGLLAGLIIIPIAFLVLVIINRISLEMTIVLFRIAESTGDTAKNTRVLADSTRERVTA